jgi:hypothetical protein
MSLRPAFPERGLETGRQERILAPGTPDFGEPRLQQYEVALRSSSPFSHGLTHVRPDEASMFEPIERWIDRAGCDFPTGRLHDFLPDGRAVRAFIRAHQSHQDDEFQFTKAVA